ncbi:MAG: SIS domain-containing protein [Streptosporangiales bacterium]
MGSESNVSREIARQPECWRKAATVATDAAGLPEPGERVAVVGCGTSRYIAAAFAALREQRGAGETDAFAASEWPERRRYDRVLAISRSGTTTEVVGLLRKLRERAPTTVIVADPTTPAAGLAEQSVVLGFADERSIVQTRFATSTLALLRAHLGEDVDVLAQQAESALADALPEQWGEATQFTFLGCGLGAALADEAALKIRETSQSWAESYPAMEYRHGPMSITDERSLVWFLGEPPRMLVDEARRFGATVVHADRDPMAELVRVQRLAVTVAERRGLDPDRPRNLARSVVLPPPA